jgi:integrase
MTPEGKTVLYCRLIANRLKTEFSTGIYVYTEDWNSKYNRCEEDVEANKRLSEFETTINDIVSELQYDNKVITVKLIAQIYKGTITKVYTIGEFFYHYLYDSDREKILAPGYFKKFITLGNHLEKFTKEKFDTIDFDMRNINYAFISDFDVFLKKVTSNQYHKPLSPVYIYKMHGMFRTIIIQAYKEGIIRKQVYQDFKIRSVKTEIKYLSSAELDRIKRLDLRDNVSLDRVRDVFLFSVYTGLRFKDAQTITMDDIDYVDEKPTYLITYQEKTNDKVEIPILKPTMDIIEKYRDYPDRIKNGVIIPRFSNAKLNVYLKVIGNLAQIKLKLTHHVARHTCATTVLLENNVPLDEVSKWLGHTDVRSTRIYAQITKKKLSDTADRLNDIL